MISQNMQKHDIKRSGVQCASFCISISLTNLTSFTKKVESFFALMSNVHETDNEFEDQNNAMHTYRKVIRRTKVVDTYQQEKNVIISEFHFKYLFQSESNSFHYFLLLFYCHQCAHYIHFANEWQSVREISQKVHSFLFGKSVKHSNISFRLFHHFF